VEVIIEISPQRLTSNSAHAFRISIMSFSSWQKLYISFRIPTKNVEADDW
jgi:hypothetical protein